MDDQHKPNESKLKGRKDDLADMLSRFASTGINKASMKNLATVLRSSVKVQRHGVTLSGESMAELLLRTAPRIPVRNLETLQTQYGGMTDTALAAQVIRAASRNSAAVGGVTGALASAGELAPPFWIMLPVEVVVETLIIASIEMKMVAELHEVYGKSLQGDAQDRGLAILQSWSERKGVDIEKLKEAESVSKALGKSTGSQIIQAFRRRLMVRLAGNVSSLAPLFIGAVAGAELNRRATRDMGDALVRDLAY